MAHRIVISSKDTSVIIKAVVIVATFFLHQSHAIEHLTFRGILHQRNSIITNLQTGSNVDTDQLSHSRKEEKARALSDIEELYIEQRLDHFKILPKSISSSGEVHTLKQRYFYTSRYTSSSTTPLEFSSTFSNEDTAKNDVTRNLRAGTKENENEFESIPTSVFAFLCVGGEGPSLTKHVLLDSVHCSGDMLELAKQLYKDGHQVHLFALEHRYYGKSYPDFDNPVSNENLIYLSSRQALADLAHFVSTMNSDRLIPLHTKTNQKFNESDVKWITFGGSYPGMLSAWARLKFPHLIFASVSNSSPVQAQVDFPEYNNHVSFALSDKRVGGSKECLDVVTEGHAQVAALLSNDNDKSTETDENTEVDENLTKVASLFNVCGGADGLKAQMDRNVFLGDGLISLDVQENDPSCTEKLCNIEKICKYLVEQDESVSYMDRLASLSSVQRTNEKCIKPSWDELLEYLSSPESKVYGTRSWIWQTCTEFGFYQTCEVNSYCPYGKGFHNLDQDLEICQKAFDIDKDIVQSNVQASLEFYGGWDLKSSRIIFTNGDIDPWSMLSVTGKRGNKKQPAIIVEGASHHFWTHEIQPSDSKDVMIGRAEIYYQVQQWIGIEEEEAKKPKIA